MAIGDLSLDPSPPAQIRVFGDGLARALLHSPQDAWGAKNNAGIEVEQEIDDSCGDPTGRFNLALCEVGSDAMSDWNCSQEVEC